MRGGGGGRRGGAGAARSGGLGAGRGAERGQGGARPRESAACGGTPRRRRCRRRHRGGRVALGPEEEVEAAAGGSCGRASRCRSWGFGESAQLSTAELCWLLPALGLRSSALLKARRSVPRPLASTVQINRTAHTDSVPNRLLLTRAAKPTSGKGKNFAGCCSAAGAVLVAGKGRELRRLPP